MLGLLGLGRTKLEPTVNPEKNYSQISHSSGEYPSSRLNHNGLTYTSHIQDIVCSGPLELSDSCTRDVTDTIMHQPDTIMHQPDTVLLTCEDTDDSGCHSDDRSNDTSFDGNDIGATDVTHTSRTKCDVACIVTYDIAADCDVLNQTFEESEDSAVHEDEETSSECVADRTGNEKKYSDINIDEQNAIQINDSVEVSENLMDADSQNCVNEVEEDSQSEDEDSSSEVEDGLNNDDHLTENEETSEEDESEEDSVGYQSQHDSAQSDSEDDQTEEEADQDEDDEEDEDEQSEAQSEDEGDESESQENEDSEGGWISSGGEDNITIPVKKFENGNDSDSDDEMFDLFGDDKVIDYENDIPDDEPIAILNKPTRKSGRRSQKPVVPPHRKNVASYPKKGRYTRQTGVVSNNINRIESFNDSFNWHEGDSSEEGIGSWCSPAPPMKNGGYQFPRTVPEDINDICEFWEYDFQVDSNIIPKMANWEKLGVAPSHSVNSHDFQRYMTYKALYLKWMQCHKCKDQWYRKYGWSSLRHVLHFKPPNRKIYPDQCEPIAGLGEEVDRFKTYYDCLSMPIAGTSRSVMV